MTQEPLDPVTLTTELIRFPSLNPPGLEADIVAYLGDLLREAGFSVAQSAFAEGRPSIVATIQGSEDLDALVFAGHIDVVPLGETPWSHPPFEGTIVDGRLYGRGASDMKSGVAAYVAAAVNQARKDKAFRRSMTLVIVSGEETGCEGSFHLAREGLLGDAGFMVVAEPSSNLPVIAHKGSLRLSVTARGRTAHSSMPWVGDNAVSKIARFIRACNLHRFDIPDHPLLGAPSASVTTVTGGMNINSVPDAAGFTVDIRTLPDQNHAEVVSELQALWGDDAEIEVITNFKGFSTEPDDPALEPLMGILETRLGARPTPTGEPYFTDASALVPAYGNVPTVVLGPGLSEQCHRTDEYCEVQSIRDCADIYDALITAICR